MADRIKSFFENIAKIWLQQLPLFIMLVIYTTVPVFFSGAFSYKTYLLIVLPQVILPSMLLCVVASWRRWSWWIVFVFANLLWLIEMGCYFCQHQRMWSYIALLIAQSNSRETGEFISVMYADMIKAFIAMNVSAGVIYVFDHWWRKKSENFFRELQGGTRHIILRSAGFIIALSVIYSPVTLYSVASKGIHSYKRVFSTKDIESACSWIMYAYALHDIINNPRLKNLTQLVDTIATTEITFDERSDSLTVVYVIGESFSRNRSSLYGYPYDTNPLMAKEQADSSLITFDNVISHWHITAEVYRMMMSTCNIQDDKPFESYPLLPALMKKAGYKVAYLDNQGVISYASGDLECSYFLGAYQLRDYCLDMSNDHLEEYDADFVNKYGLPYLESGRDNFTIIHLMGQHSVYDARYPASFTHFTKADYDKFEGLSDEGAYVMSALDNATLYNDYTLHTIIEKIRDKNAILIYSSDHGEEAYDYREAGMIRYPEFPLTSVRLYYEVPVMIWMSDSFRQKYPDIVLALRSNTHKAIYNSDLPHTILDIAGIHTETFNPNVSLLREGGGRTHRHVWMNDVDYDAKRDEIYQQKLRYEK